MNTTTNGFPELVTSKELQAYLRVCRGTAERFGKACGAERRIGRKLLFDLATVKAALDTQRKEEA